MRRDMLLLFPRSASTRTCFQPCATQIMHAQQTIRATRAFQTSAYLDAKQKPAAVKQKAAPKKSQPPTALPYRPQPKATTPTAPKSNALALSVAERLADRGERTVLYEGPSHFWLRASGLSASVFCMSYVGIQYYSIMVYPPEGLAWWVPHAFVPILLLMGYFGGHFAFSAANIVSSITAVPKALVPRSYLTGGAAKRTKQEERSLAALNASPIALEVSLSQMLPLLPPKKLVVAPEEVLFPFKMQSTPVGRGAVVDVEAPRRPKGAMDKIAAPFEAFGKALRRPLNGIVRGLTREGFAKIKIKDRKHRIDVTGGKVLEKGKLLDHLVAYRPERV